MMVGSPAVEALAGQLREETPLSDDVDLLHRHCRRCAWMDAGLVRDASHVLVWMTGKRTGRAGGWVTGCSRTLGPVVEPIEAGWICSVVGPFRVALDHRAGREESL
jgi:hypothetical protein